MLVRCEHCGSALPQEASKCYKCGNRHQPFVPPPIPPEALDEIQRMDEKAQRREKILSKVMPYLILASIVVAIVSFIVMSNIGTLEGIRTSSIVGISSICTIIFCILLWMGVVIFDSVRIRAKRENVQATQRPPEPDREEYEQRIRDFINYC